MPFLAAGESILNLTSEDSGALGKLVFVAQVISYIIFLRGLFFLRKMARSLLSHKQFSLPIIQNLKKSGSHFIYAGILSFIILFALWLGKLLGGSLELTYDNNLIIPLFLSIIGLFFIIQSETLALAKDIKEENELTV